jgi:hypothetical protein
MEFKSNNNNNTYTVEARLSGTPHYPQQVFFNFTVLSGIVGSWPPFYPESSNEIEI